jgi:hypothetical protein
MFQLSTISRKAASGLSAFALSIVSHAEIIEVKWDADGEFERAQSIAPGKFLEICENLPKESVVTWHFAASAPLNFNIHYHQGKDVVFPEKQDSVSEREGTLVARSGEDYCWMWSNKGAAAISIRVRLAKAATKR